MKKIHSEEQGRWICTAEMDGQRADKVLCALFKGVPRHRIHQWLELNLFNCNHKQLIKSRKLKPGDLITWHSLPKKPDPSRVTPEIISLNIVYEDKWLAVVDKPKAMVVHPGAGQSSGTLANALMARFSGLNQSAQPGRPGIVHRLDKDTTGLLLVAKDDETNVILSEMIKTRQIKRRYRALCFGHPEKSGVFNQPVGRHPVARTKQAVIPDGKNAVTHFKVCAYYRFCSDLELDLETGRTHQIRVHLSHAGYSILGDEVYGGGKGKLKQVEPIDRPVAAKTLATLTSQALHAWKLEFIHPFSGEKMELISNLPEEMSKALEILEQIKI